MAAKQLLPLFGGSAAVWVTCLVFFQAGVLGGYLYARWLALGPVWLGWVHAGLLGLSVAAAAAWAGGWLRPEVAAEPVAGILGSLLLCVGLPFCLLASTSPLLQVLWARDEDGAVPYWLFGVSNLASLLALFCYPAVLEAHATLRLQRVLWACGVAAYAALSGWLVLRPGRSVVVTDRPRFVSDLDTNERAGLRTRALWFALPLVGSMQLSAVTGHLTANVAAMPLLWVLPLAAYLLSFVVAFDLPALYSRAIYTRLLLVMLAALGYLLAETDMGLPVGVGIGFFVLELLLACVVCHAETYRLRPARVGESTLFYLLIAGGGATGAVLVGIALPLLTRANYDVALVFLLTALAVLAVVWGDGWSQRVLWAVSAGLAVFLVVAIARVYGHGALLETRNFYGSLRVKESATAKGEPLRVLMNGQTEHGSEIFTPAMMRMPTTYYAPDSGVGLAMAQCCVGRPRRVGVIGLGAGTLAAYGQSGDTLRFYEINPAVPPAAQYLFTYLRGASAAGARLDVVQGDARRSLEGEPPQGFDVLVVDAFSGDAIPVHLLTREAMQVYRRQLAPGGVIAFHVSNRYVDLAPEVGALSRDAGLASGEVTTGDKEATGEFRAVWVLVGPSAWFAQPAVAARVRPVEYRAGIPAWTDDFSSLLPLMRW